MNAGADADDAVAGSFQWTAATVAQSVAVFCLAGLAEIGGG